MPRPYQRDTSIKALPYHQPYLEIDPMWDLAAKGKAVAGAVYRDMLSAGDSGKQNPIRLTSDHSVGFGEARSPDLRVPFYMAPPPMA